MFSITHSIVKIDERMRNAFKFFLQLKLNIGLYRRFSRSMGNLNG